MQAKFLFLAFISFVCLIPNAQAQLLKKIKDKVNKTINSDSGSDKEEAKSSSAGDNPATNSSGNKSNESTKGPKWCDGLETSNTGGSEGTSEKDGVEYRKVYTSEGGFRVLYDESSLNLSNTSKGFRLVLSERVNNKTQFKLVENGGVVATANEVKPEWIKQGASGGTNMKTDDNQSARMSKYIVGDTLKQKIPKTDAKKVEIQEIDDDQVNMALNIARQTDDYKNMSEEEKKEFEKAMREGIAQNNARAGTTYDIPAQNGGTMAMVNGYLVVVKGKKYGKFMIPPAVEVSPDESKVFVVGMNEQGKPVMVTNGKSTLLDANKYSATNGRMVKSADGKKFVYLEQKKMSDKELEEYTRVSSTGQPAALQYNVIRSDGSSVQVTDHNYSGRFYLTNSGELVCINERTGEVFADNKSIGKFPLEKGETIQPESVLIGSDITKIAYYTGSEGSLTYLDGSVKKLDIIYPAVVSEGGKSYLSWFRKCGNAIYIARFGY